MRKFAMPLMLALFGISACTPAPARYPVCPPPPPCKKSFETPLPTIQKATVTKPTTFEGWKKAYGGYGNSMQDEEEAIAGMIKTARNFNHCDYAQFCSEKASVNLAALKCKFKFSKTLKHFSDLAFWARKGSTLHTNALHGMLRTANGDFVSCERVYYDAPKKSQLQLDAAMCMTKTAKNRKEWENTAFATGAWPPLRKKAIENMDRLAQTKADCVMVVFFTRLRQVKFKPKNCKK